jgi:hypothetical protein
MQSSPQPAAGNGATAARELAAQAFDIAAGELWVAYAVAEREGNKDRRRKMEAVVADSLAALKRARPDGGIPAESGPDVLEALLLADKDRFSTELAIRAAIEWCADNPFAPSSLKFKDDKVYDAAAQPARALGLDDRTIKDIRQTVKSARDSQSHVEHDKGLLLGIGATPLTLLTGTDAPEGADTAGLARKAALLRTLLALSGGAVETGGLGISAGVWLLVPHADGDSSRALIGAVLEDLDAATLQAEVIKAQAAFKEIYLRRPGRTGFSEALEAMHEKRAAVQDELEERRQRNEEDAETVKECQQMLRSVDDGLKWMLAQVAA